MSVAEVERRAESWFNCVQMLAGRVDVGRSQLVVDHPVLGTLQPAGLAVPVAVVSKGRILAMIQRRIAEFPIGRSVRDGAIWSSLLAEYVAVKNAILCVTALLDSSVAFLLHIENSLPSTRRGAGVAHLSSVLRIYFRDIQRVLGDRTDRLLQDADPIFGIDRSSWNTTPSQISDTGRPEGV